MSKSIINKFSVLLTKNRIRITKVSRDTGISRTTLTKLYYDKNARISIETLEKLCNYLDCSVEDIISMGKEIGV